MFNMFINITLLYYFKECHITNVKDLRFYCYTIPIILCYHNFQESTETITELLFDEGRIYCFCAQL